MLRIRDQFSRRVRLSAERTDNRPMLSGWAHELAIVAVRQFVDRRERDRERGRVRENLSVCDDTNEGDGDQH